MATPTPEERQYRAVLNLQHALKEAKTGIHIASFRLAGDGCQIIFTKGHLAHIERGVDPSTLDDGVETAVVRRLVQKVDGAFVNQLPPKKRSRLLTQRLNQARHPSQGRELGPLGGK